MRKRCPQWLGLTVILLLVLSVLVPAPAQANPKADAWTRCPIPEKGWAGGWVLTSDVSGAPPAEGTGVTAICVAYDGTLYAATEETLGSPLSGFNLFKSTDGGYFWTPLWTIPAGDRPAGGPTSKIISLLLPRWEYPDILYLATQYNVYKSTDGGKNFTTIGTRPAYGSGAPPASCLITSLDVTYYNNNHLLLVGSSDADLVIMAVFITTMSRSFFPLGLTFGLAMLPLAASTMSLMSPSPQTLLMMRTLSPW